MLITPGGMPTSWISWASFKAVREVSSAGIDPAVPFGGFKQSGWGRENGYEGAEHFYETKTVSVAL